LAPHEKIWVNSEIAEDENHGELSCEECHGGDPNEPDWKKAHVGLVKDPSYLDASKTCGTCHETIAENYQKSLHVTLSPFTKMIDTRADSDKNVHAKVNAGRENHCNACHSSCGQCHISRPESAEGGLLDGHLFQKQPPIQLVCTACHGSRIEKEYFGKNKDIPPDIHKEKYFKCTKCHKAEEMHGDGKDYANRYEVENGPKCIDCHKNINDEKSNNAKQHLIHKDRVSCNVCHSMPYKNCYACHVGKDKLGYKFFKTKASTLEFKIGLNPLKSQKRPEKFVTLRHIPVDQGTYKFYTDNGLANFDKLPTWKLCTPHNIRKSTPQNKTCNSCHENTDLFLLEKDIKQEYLNANRKVVVPRDMLPKKVDE